MRSGFQPICFDVQLLRGHMPLQVMSPVVLTITLVIIHLSTFCLTAGGDGTAHTLVTNYYDILNMYR